MSHRIAIAAACGLLAACSSNQPTNPVGAAGSSAGGQVGVSGSAAGGGAGMSGQSTGGSGQSAGAAGQGVGGGGQSAGGAAGSAGSGGSGGSALTLTMPIVRGDLDVLEMGPLSFAVNPSKGARIVSFKLDGDELLTDTTPHPQYYGSTLWTGPATDWVPNNGFSPPAVVDSDPYVTTVGADNVITATSASSTTMNTGKKFVVTKTFRADLAKNAIVIEYGLKNTGNAPFKLSHWEVTRVFPNGLMFFPTGAMTKLDYIPAQPAKVTMAAGYTWYDNTTHMMGQGESKGGADSPGGFIAQVAPHAKGDLLFVKAFKAVPLAGSPTGELPVEFYCNDPHTYVELEEYSSYDDIAVGATYTQTVTWYLRRLPMGTDRTIGSAALIAAAQATLGK